MTHLDPTRTARGLIALTGNNHRLYVPGSLRILMSGSMEWDETCKAGSTDCLHARSALIPTGRVDPHRAAT